MTFKGFIIIQLKRIRRIFPGLAAILVVMAGCMALLAGRVFDSHQESNGKKLRVGLVGDVGDSYLGFGVEALQTIDDTRYSVEFINMTEEEAKYGMEIGDLSGYVVIPEGFIGYILSGENRPATYVTTAGGMEIGSVVARELTDTISTLLTNSQGVIYSTQQYMRDNGHEEDFWDKSDKLYLELLDFILGRASLFDMEFVGLNGYLTYNGYYMCSLFVLFILVWGMVGCIFYVRNDYAMDRLLISRGLTRNKLLLGEYLAYFLTTTFVAFCGLMLLGTLMQTAGVVIPEWWVSSKASGQELAAQQLQGWSELKAFQQSHTALFYEQLLKYFVRMVPAIWLLASMQFLLYEISSNPVGGMLLQFMLGIFAGYASGCFYPITFFPLQFRELMGYLPVGASIEYAGKWMIGASGTSEFIRMVIWAVLIAVLIVLSRRRNVLVRSK